ncbi:hypothetical protein FGO68_gene15283 [Halteria grandinella]|uniref:TRP C-terminal domain-containing protein n=1 Tax=Halteria grandinella TaxID=5974 RepID=A0A8J8T9H9_HALGN|nr:hypothetical protein FGO68_gene15283 [Halteria grandinella]
MISIPIPGIASPIQSLISTIIYMDLLLTDKWLTSHLDESSESNEDEPLNIFFESQGFQSKHLFINLGSTLVFMIMQICLLMFTGLMSLFSSTSSRAEKLFEFLHKRLIWGRTIRFIIQQFQPLIFSSLINIRSQSLLDLKPSTIATRFNFYLSALIFTGTLLSVVIFYGIILRGKAGEQRFSTLIEGLKSNTSGFAAYWTVWTLLKWSLMCFILILLTDYPAQQLQTLTLLSAFSTILQISVQPMDSRIENMMCTFNELMATIYLYTLIGLATAGDDIALRENLGLALISILLLALSTNILKVLIMIICEIVKKIRRKCTQNERVAILSQHSRKYASTMPLTQEEAKSEGNVK